MQGGRPSFLTPIATHPTSWNPENVVCPLSISLDACFVPISTGGVRLDTANIVVLDNFISEKERKELLDHITHPDWDHALGPPPDKWEKATSDAVDQPRTWGLKANVLKQLSCSSIHAKVEVQSRLAGMYPEVHWCHQPSEAIQARAPEQPGLPMGSAGALHSQNTIADGRTLPASEQSLHQEECSSRHAPPQTPSQGLREPRSHQNLTQAPCSATNEATQKRDSYQTLAPPAVTAACLSAHQHGIQQTQMPPETRATGHSLNTSGIHQAPTPPTTLATHEHASICNASSNSGIKKGLDHDRPGDEDGALEGESSKTFDCSSILANAATHGDKFGWHQDADPMTFPPSVWTSTFGWYANREPGKPVLVSLILYLNEAWPKEWGAETLFLDTPSDTGVLVRPKAYRAVLMDQDVLHRLSQPSHHAGSHPRYSLVWKLVMLPKTPNQACSIAKPELCIPTAFGSSAKADAVVRQMARKRKAAEFPV